MPIGIIQQRELREETVMADKQKPKCGNLWCDGNGQLVIPADTGSRFVDCPYCQRIETDVEIKKLREVLAPFAAAWAAVADEFSDEADSCYAAGCGHTNGDYRRVAKVCGEHEETSNAN